MTSLQSLPNDLPNLRELSLTELLTAWDRIDDKGRDLNGVRALCKVDRFYLLVKGCKRYDVWHPWVYARCREVERAPDGYLDLWAREHFKSTIITFAGIVQEILNNPDITIGIFSHTKPIAKGFLAQIKRELESNELLKAAFPDVLWQEPHRDSPSWSLDGGLIVRRKQNPKESTVEAHGLVDGQPTSKHFGLLVYDDVVTLESVSTTEQTDKTTNAWSLSDNLGTITGRKWHIGTRYNYADTYETIMKRGVVKPRIYPATDNGLFDGRPVLLTPEQWDEKKRIQGEAVIACQMLQNPLSGAQRMFDIADLREYEIRPETLNVYVLCDPARSKKKESANTAIVVLGVDYALNKYLLDGINQKCDLMERWKWIRDLWVKWVQAPGVQSCRVGYEKFGAQADMDYFNERRQVERVPVPINELEWPSDGPGSKVDRVQRLGPDVRTHRIFLPYATTPETLTRNQREMQAQGYGYRVSRSIKRKDHEGNVYDLSEHFKQQLNFFPYGGLKDLVDAMSRVYDMEVCAPALVDQSSLEPDFC